MYSDRKQTGGCLRTGKQDHKGTQGNFGGDGCVHYLDYGGGFIDA